MPHYELNPFTKKMERTSRKETRGSSGAPLTGPIENITLADELIEIDATDGDVTVNILFSAVGTRGKELNIVKVDSSNHVVVVNPYLSETINDCETMTIRYQNNAMNIVSNNLNWRII